MSSKQPTIADRVRKIVAANVNWGKPEKKQVTEEQITNDRPLFQDLASLDIEELILDLEKEFQCSIPNADAEKLRTVGDAIRYLEEKAPRG